MLDDSRYVQKSRLPSPRKSYAHRFAHSEPLKTNHAMHFGGEVESHSLFQRIRSVLSFDEYPLFLEEMKRLNGNYFLVYDLYLSSALKILSDNMVLGI